MASKEGFSNVALPDCYKKQDNSSLTPSLLQTSALSLTPVLPFTRSPRRPPSPGRWPLQSDTSPFCPKSGLKRHNITPSAGPLWPGYNAPLPPPPPSTSVSTPLSSHFLPNHPIIGCLSLVNVPSHSADESFISMARVRPELAAGGGVGRRMERALCGPEMKNNQHTEQSPFEVHSAETLG